MNKKDVQEAIKKVSEGSKRNFAQSYDLIVNLQDLNLKNPDEQVDFYVTLHHGTGKPIKIVGLVGAELAEESKKNFDTTIEMHDFEKYDKKTIKKLAQEHDYFVAQATIMPKVATTFGRVLGPRNKMPNPKAGCVVPPKAALTPLKEKLQKTIRVTAKKSPVIQLKAGNQNQKEEEVIDNILLLYDQIIHHLPKEVNNVRSILLKTTMGKPVKLQ